LSGTANKNTLRHGTLGLLETKAPAVLLPLLARDLRLRA
jgi:hypothetical protein